MKAFAVRLRSDAGHGGPTYRERTVVASDASIACSKALRAARKFVRRGYRVISATELPELVR